MDVRTFSVHARWDGEAGRWWTDGEEIPGLCCEASTFEELVELVVALAPELLVANGVVASDAGDIGLTVTAERHATARLVA